MNQVKESFWTIDKLLIALCVLLGLILRIGNPAELSFINDELSTWSKVSYDSVGEVIANIRAVDSHPIGMYVFVYYWTGIFGTSEWAIKLPFILMSLASMFFVYRIASLWFNSTVALLVLAFFCSLQFPIWWSHIARQYQSGLLTTLIMVYCWTQILIKEKNDLKYWLGFVLMGTLSMYNHYFSLIFAGVVGLSGFVWMRKEILVKYIVSGVLMVLLFAPHIEITNYQMTTADGHKWYNIPTPSFLTNHFCYIFHYSVLCWGLVLALFVGSMLLFAKNRVEGQMKSSVVALCWFLTPLLFGYFYSVYQSPILRESHLLFSFPYLLLFLLSFFPKELSKGSKLGLVVLILLINTYTLIATRSHFQTAHTHPYEHFIVETKAFLAAKPDAKPLIVLGENPEYLNYYKAAYQANFEHVNSFRPSIEFKEFRNLLEKNTSLYVIVGSLPETLIQMAMDYYPYLYKKSYGINYEYYILSKEQQPQTTPLKIDYQADATFDYGMMPDGWTYEAYQIIQHPKTGDFYFNMNTEWGPTYIKELSRITPRNNQFLEIAVDVRIVDSIATQPKGELVIELINEQDSIVLRKASPVESQTIPSKEWQRVFLSTRFAHENIYENVKNLRLRTYFWNREKQALHLDRFTITSRKGNILLYGDTNNFRKGDDW